MTDLESVKFFKKFRRIVKTKELVFAMNSDLVKNIYINESVEIFSKKTFDTNFQKNRKNNENFTAKKTTSRHM